MTDFFNYGLSALTLDALKAIGISTPTSIQDLAIQPLLEWKDVIAKAPTGTGKTFAFGLPIIEHCEVENTAIQALILAPTRELAVQIGNELKALTSNRPWINPLVLYGGENLKTQITALKQEPRIIVATPGRFLDHLSRGRLNLTKLNTVILDEADRMLDMGFIDDVRRILDQVKHVRQVGLFSATLSRSVMDISWLYQHSPLELCVDAVEEDKPQIDEYYVHANGSERITAIRDIMHREKLERALVFVNMKQSAEITARKLSAEGFTCACLEGDMAQNQRTRVMKQFREGEFGILVATDVAARGLDIDDVDIVFNYDIPIENENYIHRIGRTGRAKRRGIAVSFIPPSGQARFNELMRKVKSEPLAYEWSAENTEVRTLSEEEQEAAILRIREKSVYLNSGAAERAYQKPLEHAGRRSFGQGRGSAKRDPRRGSSPSPGRNSTAGRRSDQGRPKQGRSGS